MLVTLIGLKPVSCRYAQQKLAVTNQIRALDPYNYVTMCFSGVGGQHTVPPLRLNRTVQ